MKFFPCRRSNRIISILIVCAMPSAGWCQHAFGEAVDSLITAGIDQTFRSHFDSALTTFGTICRIHPEHPAGYFYKAATLQSKMMDFETDAWEDQFYGWIDAALERAEKRIGEDVEDPWMHFFRGSALSYKGLYQAKSGELIRGFLSARKGLGSLRHAFELDSTLFECLLGLGSYKYWAGKYYTYLKWLPWIKDERGTGLRMVRKAVQESRFSRWVAVNSLAWMEWDRGEYGLAEKLFSVGLKKYPGSRFFLWGMADSYFGEERYREAIPYYRRILASVRNEPFNNGFNEALCLVKLSLCSYRLKDYKTAFQRADEALGLSLAEKEKERLKDQLNTARSLRRDSLEKLGRIEHRGE